MKPVTAFLVRQLLMLHTGNFLIKLKASFYFAFPLSVVTWCIAKITEWTISNQDYIAGVLACIAIDHIVGSIYHAFKVRDFSFKKNATGLLMKIGLCVSSVILFEIIHTAIKDVPLVYDYLKIITRLMVILYPAGSAFMNMSAVTNGAFPPLGWIKKIKTFNETLDLDKIKPENGPHNT